VLISRPDYGLEACRICECEAAAVDRGSVKTA
jgi:hypothetical protein